MRRLLTVVSLLGSLGLLLGCGSEAGVSFYDPAGPVALREERVPGVFRLDRSVAASRASQAFFLEYRGSAGGRTLRLLSPEGQAVAQRALIDTGRDSLRLLVPLPPDRVFSRIQIAPPPDPGLTVKAMGLTAAQEGFSAADGTPSAGPRICSWRREGQSWEIGLEAGALPPVAEAPAWRLELLLESLPMPGWARFRAAEAVAGQEVEAPYTGPERAAAVITVSDGLQQRRFLYQGLAGVHPLYLYPAVVPFVPRTVRIDPLGGSRLWLDRLALVPGAETPAQAAPQTPLPGPWLPLPADPGVVLLYDPAHWRSPIYELFAWSRFPRVLILDTADYAVQSRFFKRLAFFVEKRGYRGRLVSNEEVADRHGFNAHDYRAEDLARFFGQAAELEFPLNPEEEQLRAILLANRILKVEGGRYLPGDGAVISISRSSGALLRRHLLTHEAFHGAFFASQAYRRSCFALWETLGEGERGFWLLFFHWMGYDTEDSYLAVNELQAYLFQQERREVGPYFRGVTAGRLLASYPERRQGILDFLSAEPQAFERCFDRLERNLVETVGLEGGRVVGLSPLSER